MTTLASAFPAALAEDVAVVAALMPPRRSSMSSSSWSVAVSGESVAVLGRVYNDEPAQDAVLSPRQRTILQCIYTRNHDGYVRQKYVQQVVGSTEPWVVPFILEIAGEYLPQILDDINQGLPDLDLYAQFIRANPAYFDRLQRRIVSYWTCFWRADYPTFATYPGGILIESLREAESPGWRRLTPR
jgi:hypothetical protein